MLENSISSQSESDRPPKWPWLPWIMLVGLILWLLFGKMSCAVKPTLIPQTETTSRVVSANYGTFSTLDFASSRNFLLSGTMSDGRINILYKSATEIEPIIFDPATTTFIPRHESIFFRKNVKSGKINQALLINDSTVVVTFGGAEEILLGGGEESTWTYGKIINLDSGEVTDIIGQEQIGEIRVLAELNDQKFAIAGIKGKAHRDMLVTDPNFDKIPTGVVKTFDLTGKEIESKDITGMDSYAVPTTTATNAYDRGNDILIFADRLTIFDKTKLTFTPVSNTIGEAVVKYLPNNLLLVYPESFKLNSSSGGATSDEIYLVDSNSLQSIPLKLATAFPIREQLLTGITEFTDEKLTAALAPLKLQYRISVLTDGTILLAANSLYDIAAYNWLIDLNGYKMLQPVNQTERTRLSDRKDGWGKDKFKDDITLADGRVLYLGTQNVLYTPASERTAEQTAIIENRTNLPDWPSTDFKTQGVWTIAGQSKIVNDNKAVEKTAPYSSGLQSLPALLGIFPSGNSAEFFWGGRDIGDTISAIVESWQYGSKTTTNLQKDSTKTGTGVKQTYPIHDKYTAMLAEQKQERYIVKTKGKTYRIKGRDVEYWNAKTKQWVNIYQENYDKLKTKAEKQKKSFGVVDNFYQQLVCDSLPSGIGIDKKTCEADQARQKALSDKAIAEGKSTVISREEVGGTLVGGIVPGESTYNSVTKLTDGKILIVGTNIWLNAKDSLDGLGCFYPIDNKGRYTRNCATGSFTLPATSGLGVPTFKGNPITTGSNRGVEIYDPKTNKSKMIGQLTLGRGGSQLIVLPDDRVAVIGGSAEEIWTKDETMSEKAKTDSYGGSQNNPTYEIIDLKTGQSKLYENILMYRHDANDFQAFVMPNGHIYIGDSGVYSDAEVLDWQSGVSYPTGQPTLQGLGIGYTTARLENGELVSVGAHEDRYGDDNYILDSSVIETYRPANTGRQLPIAQPTTIREVVSDSYAWLWFLYLQLAQLITVPFIYITAMSQRRRQKFLIPL